MLNSLNPNDWDIIALQEPYIDFNGVTRATPPWRVIYPSRHYSHPGETRSVMLINKKLATNFWESLPINSSDITAVRLSGNFGQVRIFNIYNDCTHSRTLECLEHYLLTPPVAPAVQDIFQHDIWVGDFNRHDPMWESPDNPQLFTAANLDAAEILINLLADFAMNIALEPGVPTLEHLVTKNLHRVDHVFCSQTFRLVLSVAKSFHTNAHPRQTTFRSYQLLTYRLHGRGKSPNATLERQTGMNSGMA
jgi:endonuclease/exonuclease/phosphatase family metal-dependent hydrolase